MKLSVPRSVGKESIGCEGVWVQKKGRGMEKMEIETAASSYYARSRENHLGGGMFNALRLE